MDMHAIMKQAKKMQDEMSKLKDEAEEKIYTASAGGGSVRVKVNGLKKAVSVTIDESVFSEDDHEMLCDLIVIAFNSAMDEIDRESNAKFSEMTGGVDINGILG